MEGKYTELGFCVAVAFVILAGSIIEAESQEEVFAELDSVDKTLLINYRLGDNTSYQIKSFRMWLSDNSFESFKVQAGWVGQKLPNGVLEFSTANPLQAGESVKFGIKTEVDSSSLNWKALDENGQEVTTSKTFASSELSPTTDGIQTDAQVNGILDESIFRFVPEKPEVGTTVRVAGEGFAPNHELDFYVEETRLSTFETNGNGEFVTTVTIPEQQPADRTDFVVRDMTGNEKVMSFRIYEPEQIIEDVEHHLTIQTDKRKYAPTEEIIFSGTAQPSSSVVVSIFDPSGNKLTDIAQELDLTGRYSFSHLLPIDAPLGEYKVETSDGKTTIDTTFEVNIDRKITIEPQSLSYEAGDTVVLSGTAVPDEVLDIVVEDSLGRRVAATSVLPESFGEVHYEFPLSINAPEGTWPIFLQQGEETELALFGVGKLPEEIPIIRADKLNYASTDTAVFKISGPKSTKVTILVLDQAGGERFSDKTTLRADGSLDYELKIGDHLPNGVYDAVVTIGNKQSFDKFSVGLQRSSETLVLNTVKEAYTPGEPVLAMGKTAPETIVSVTLFNPDDEVVEQQDVISMKSGLYSTSFFKIPLNAQQGFWELVARTDQTYDKQTVRVLLDDAMTVQVDKNPAEYEVGEILKIDGFNAKPDQLISLGITSEEGVEIESMTMLSTDDGTFSFVWEIPQYLTKGNYIIQVSDVIQQATASFTIIQNNF